MMVDASGSWRQLYDLANQEIDPERQRQLCAQARRLIQDRLLQLRASSAEDPETGTLERALRELWNIDRNADSP
jgi:hypothetical protein